MLTEEHDWPNVFKRLETFTVDIPVIFAIRQTRQNIAALSILRFPRDDDGSVDERAFLTTLITIDTPNYGIWNQNVVSIKVKKSLKPYEIVNALEQYSNLISV